MTLRPRARSPRLVPPGRRPTRLALALGLALLAAPAASAQVSIAGYVFDAHAAPDLATPLPGSFPEFGGGTAACTTVASLPGLTLGQSTDLVFTDSAVTEWIFGKARVRLDFTDNVIVNGPGADLVVFEIGGAEGFALQVFAESICLYGTVLNYAVAATGFTTDPCANGGYAINAAEIDLDDFGVLPGAAVRRLLIDNLGQAGGSVGADLVAVMALNSAAPSPGAPDCLLSFQQGIDAGAGAYTGASDTAIAADFPATNFGSAVLEYVDGSPERNLLLRFDGIIGNGPGQIAPGATITRATLTLSTGAGAASSTGTHAIHRVLQAWNAATITYASGFGGNGVDADGIEAAVAPVGTVPAMSANETTVINITAAVQAWADGAPNHGLALLTASADGLGLHLAEAAVQTLRPALGVELSGKLGYAEVVADFSPVISGGDPVACNLTPGEALGPPDTLVASPPGTCCAADITTVTLGVGGAITLEFTSISISGNGSPEPDLWIFEEGPDVEDTFVELSADGTSWVSVGKVFGATSSLDIDQFGYGPLSLFRFIRLTDDPAEGQISGCSVGADIDAVAALAPNPWLNLGSALAGSNGVPKLAASGVLEAGGPVTFSITNGKLNGSAYFVLGLTALNAPVKGGTLVPQPTVLISGLPLGPTGALLLPTAWPAGIPAGLNVFVQCWIADATGPVGFSSTNAIKSVTQ